MPPPDPVTVTSVARTPARVRGSSSTGRPNLDQRDVRIRAGLPLTSPARALLDSPETPTDDGEVEQAIAEARSPAWLDEREIRKSLAPPRRDAGRGTPAAGLAAEEDAAITESEAERR